MKAQAEALAKDYPNSEYLHTHEIVQLTGRVRPSAQRRQLVAMRIPFDLDADGRPVVRRHREVKKPPTRTEPKWDNK